jgi:DNA-binding transcriptional LysR family regulator
MADDLNTLTAFIAVADTLNFRVASERLGVTRPAVSQALRRLEDQVGVALVQRTTRSVTLTEAGNRLYEQVGPAIAEIRSALASTADREAAPSGLLRVAVSSIAERFLSGPLLAGFTQAFPGIQLDVTVTDDEFDIVAEGYDAGVRLGEVIAQNMIAVPVSAPQRQMVVGATSYLDRAGVPLRPRDLTAHACIGWRPAPRAAPYRWEFEEDGREFDVAVELRITTNDMWLMIKTACAGGGLTFGMAETFRPYLDRGELIAMLEDYCLPFAGFFLYFPNRRNLAPKLRALVDYARHRPSADNGQQLSKT